MLFIELDPHQVDVNVHPAKHAVRFHQARLVHDFIYLALSGALVQSAQVMVPTINEGAFHLPHCAEEVNPPVVPMIEITQQERVWQAVQNTPDYPRKAPRDNDKNESDKPQVRERAVSIPW